MTKLKRKLPKRILSLVLALAMAIGFVPHIDIDLTAFAANTLTLDDSKNMSGDNWVWDYTNATLSLYNANITADIEYNGTETLKIKQIGYNRISSYIQATAIEVVGSGILDFDVASSYMFKTSALTFSNGYITSDNAARLLMIISDYVNVTISNCVLDIPNSKIDNVKTFTINSGYVTASKLASSSNYFNGGYLKFTDSENYTVFNQDTTTFGHAVVQGEYMFLGFTNNTDFDFNKFDLNGSVVLVKNVFDSSSDLPVTPRDSKTTSGDYAVYYKTDDSSAATYGQYIPANGTVPTSFSEKYAYYFASDATIETNIPANSTVVCNGKLTLNNVKVYGSNDTSYSATVYANEIESNLSEIYGCVISKNAELSGTDIQTSGRLYLTGSLELKLESTFIGENAAVTIYSKLASNGKTLDFGGNVIKVYGDFSIKNSQNNADSLFTDTEKCLIIENGGELAAAFDHSKANAMFSISNSPYSTIKDVANTNERFIYAAERFGDPMKIYASTLQPKSLYIGDEFSAQLIALTESDDIVCKKVYEDSAEFDFLCSHDIDNLDDVTVTVYSSSTSSNAITGNFIIAKSYVDETDKTKIRLTITLNQNVGVQDYPVKVKLGDLEATATLKATNIKTTLDFTKTDADAWWFLGDFAGTNTECKATNDMWAWYPNGAEGYTGKVLVLNDLEIQTIAANAIVVPADTTIVAKGDNDIRSKNTAIYCDGNVKIVGVGSSAYLKAYSDESVPKYYAAIQSSGDLTIKDIKLYPTMCSCSDDPEGGYGTSQYANQQKSYGIYGNNVYLVDVKGSCTAGNAENELHTENDSAAICAGNTLFIDEGCRLILQAHTYALKSATLKSAEVDRLVAVYNSDKTTSYSESDINNVIGADNVVSGITNIYIYSYSNLATYNNKSINATVTIAENDKAMGDEITYTPDTAVYTSSTTDPDTVKAAKGADLTLTFNAKTGNYIKTLTVDGTNYVEDGKKVGNYLNGYLYDETTLTIIEADVLLEDIQNNVQIDVEYEAIPTCTVTLTPPQHGTVSFSPSVEGSVVKGTEVTLTATPDSGYLISKIKIDGTPYDMPNGTYTYRVDNNTTFEVLFEEIPSYGITVSSDHGSVAFSTDGQKSAANNVYTYYVDSDITFEITPETGYEVASVTLDSKPLTAIGENKYEITDISANHTLSVTYKLITYAVTVNCGEHGSLSSDCQDYGNVANNTKITFAAFPADGYKLSAVTVNGAPVEVVNNSFSVTVTSNVTIAVTFEAISSSGGSGGGYYHGTSTTTTSTIDWNGILTDINDLPKGGEITINLNGNYNVPADVVKAIADRNIKATFVIDSWRNWTLDGAKVTTPTALNLSAIQIPSLNSSSIDGTVGAKLRIEENDLAVLNLAFKKEYAGQFANVYKLEGDKYVLADVVKVDENGTAALSDIEKGDYIVMLNEFSDLDGDVSNDGKVDISDASLMLKTLFGLADAPNAAKFDFNKDGKVDIRDASDILHYCFGLV